jgi:hypothetical protein
VSDARLRRECRVFTRHLIRSDPGDYIVARYIEAHRLRPVFTATSRFDRFLCAFARVSPFMTRFADAWSAVFAPTAVLRRKLVLLLAMLESAAPQYRRLEAVPSVRALAFVSLFFRGLLAALTLVVSLVIFVPARVLLGKAGETP